MIFNHISAPLKTGILPKGKAETLFSLNSIQSDKILVSVMGPFLRHWRATEERPHRPGCPMSKFTDSCLTWTITNVMLQRCATAIRLHQVWPESSGREATVQGEQWESLGQPYTNTMGQRQWVLLFISPILYLPPIIIYEVYFMKVCFEICKVFQPFHIIVQGVEDVVSSLLSLC